MDYSNTANPNNQPQQPQQANRNQQQGTGFTNLSRVIGANQNTGLTNAVAGGLQNQTNDVKSGINSASSNTNTAIQGQNVATNENKQKAQTIINDPTQAGQQDVDQFAQFRSGAYNGPNELQNKQNLQNQTTQAQTLGGMAGSQNGRQALLQRFVGGANYGQGKQMLDSAILGQTGGTQLNQAARDTRGLGQQLGQADLAAQQQAQLVAGGNKAFASDVKNQLNSGLTGIDNSAQNNINQFNYTRDDLLSGIKTAGTFDPNNTNGSPTLSAQQYDALTKAGYDPNSYLYNLNVGDYISRSDFNPTLSSALNSDQAAKAQALAKLSGTDISQQNSLLAQAAGDSANVGTLANQQAIKFNNDQFKQAQSDSEQNLLKDYYNNYVMGHAQQGGAAGWELQGADQWLNNIIDNGSIAAGSTPTGSNGGNLSSANSATAYADQLNNGGSNPLSAGSLAQSMGVDTGALQNQANALYNTGGDYASKSNLEKAIDSLRGGEVISGGLNKYSTNFQQDPNASTAYDAAGVGANQFGGNAYGNLYLTGANFGSYADKYGRLRQLLNPSASAGAPAAGASDSSGLVGDNSANAALRAAIANSTGQS